jgi:hypothetical protein
MKKLFAVAAIFAVTVIALRRFGPALAKRAMAKCDEMMEARGEAREASPDSFASTEEPAARVAV